MYCDDCYFKSTFHDMGASFSCCTFNDVRDLSVDSRMCDVANTLDECPYYLNCGFAKSFLKHHFFDK